MGSFRYRRSIKIAPGVRWNISKTGSSFSVGGRGMTTNISRRGIRNTVGIPGTGLSYSSSRRSSGGGAIVIVFIVIAILWRFLH